MGASPLGVKGKALVYLQRLTRNIGAQIQLRAQEIARIRGNSDVHTQDVDQAIIDLDLMSLSRDPR